MTTSLRRKQQPDPVAEVSQQLATLVETLVELVTARVAATVPVFAAQPARAAYSVKEVADLLGVHRDRVYRDMHSGLIHSFRIGGEYRIPHSEIERLTAVDVDRRSA